MPEAHLRRAKRLRLPALQVDVPGEAEGGAPPKLKPKPKPRAAAFSLVFSTLAPFSPPLLFSLLSSKTLVFSCLFPSLSSSSPPFSSPLLSSLVFSPFLFSPPLLSSPLPSSLFSSLLLLLLFSFFSFFSSSSACRFSRPPSAGGSYALLLPRQDGPSPMLRAGLHGPLRTAGRYGGPKKKHRRAWSPDDEKRQ